LADFSGKIMCQNKIDLWLSASLAASEAGKGLALANLP
jgi:hypothetical protein